jgi:basic amino acid/polyamine antiporter, APA family
MSPASNDQPAGHGKLGLWDAVGIIVGIVIGTVIYAKAGTIFFFCLDPIWGLLVWVLGGLIALIGAFCYAELATTYPRAGGDYFYLSRAFGPCTGFLFGWAQLAVVMPASIGLMAYIFAEYFLRVFDPGQTWQFEVPLRERTVVFEPNFAIAAMAVALLTFTNMLGVFLGKTVQNILAIAKLVGLVGIIVAGFCWYQPGAWEYTVKPANTPYIGTLAIILVMLAYGGWNDAAFVAAEIRNPKRNIPRALLFGVGIIATVYVLVNAAYINNVGWDNIANIDSASLPTLVIGSALGENGSKAMMILIMVSALGAVNGLIFTYARVLATLGADHRLFGWMGYWRPGRGSPIVALLLQALLTIFILGALTTEYGHNAVNDALGYINEGLARVSKQVEAIDENRSIPPIEFEKQWQPEAAFDNLVARTAPVFWFFFLLTGLSLFILREKDKGTPRPFSVPLYPIVPLIFCNACAWMLYQATDYVKWHALFAIAIVLLGLPLYLFSRLISGSRDTGAADIGFPPPPIEALPPRVRSPLR